MRKVAVLVAAMVFALAALAGAAPVQKLKVTMRDFGYTPVKLTLQSGVPAEITIVNNGKVTHEFMLYGMPRDMTAMAGGAMGHEWVEKTNYFKGVPATAEGGKVKRRGGTFFELHIKPGTSAVLKFTPVRKGTFEFGCMIADHYEAGQRGILVIR